MTRGEALLEALKARSSFLQPEEVIDKEFNTYEKQILDAVRENPELAEMAASYIETGLKRQDIPEVFKGLSHMAVGWAAAERFYFEQITRADKKSR